MTSNTLRHAIDQERISLQLYNVRQCNNVHHNIYEKGLCCHDGTTEGFAYNQADAAIKRSLLFSVNNATYFQHKYILVSNMYIVYYTNPFNSSEHKK